MPRPNWFRPTWMREVEMPPTKVLYHGTATVVPSQVARQWVGPLGFYVTPLQDVAEVYARNAEVRFAGRVGPGRILTFTAEELGLRRLLVVTREPDGAVVQDACAAGFDGVWGPKMWGIYVCGLDPRDVLSSTLKLKRKLLC